MADPQLEADIAEAEKAIKTAEEELEKAKGAGVDIAELEKELEDAKEALKKLKDAYA